MKSEELTDIEMFRMALRFAEAALANVPNALTVSNRDDFIRELIIDCHSGIFRASVELFARNAEGSH